MALPVTIEAWLQAASADAERQSLPELKPLLETLAHSTAALRAADAARAAEEHRAPASSGPER